MRKRSSSHTGPTGSGPDDYGYGDLQIPHAAARTRKLQAILCALGETGSAVEDVDRTAILGLVQIVGELEAGLRAVIESE